jgi:hypothetical protein
MGDRAYPLDYNHDGLTDFLVLNGSGIGGRAPRASAKSAQEEQNACRGRGQDCDRGNLEPAGAA